jgi:hypothetical protein
VKDFLLTDINEVIINAFPIQKRGVITSVVPDIRAAKLFVKFVNSRSWHWGVKYEIFGAITALLLPSGLLALVAGVWTSS